MLFFYIWPSSRLLSGDPAAWPTAYGFQSESRCWTYPWGTEALYQGAAPLSSTLCESWNLQSNCWSLGSNSDSTPALYNTHIPFPKISLKASAACFKEEVRRSLILQELISKYKQVDKDTARLCTEFLFFQGEEQERSDHLKTNTLNRLPSNYFSHSSWDWLSSGR